MPALVWTCDTPRRLCDARHAVRGTGDGGEASSRAQACMALTLIAWEGLGPTFRSTANTGDARLRSAAPAGVSRTPKATPEACGPLSLSFVMCRWELLASWPLLVSQGVTSRLLILCPAATRRQAMSSWAATAQGLDARRRTSSPRLGQLRANPVQRSTKS